MARRKIETGAGVVGGKQAALEQARDSNKAFQNGAGPVSLNLIANAIKLTERGHIRVAVRAAFPGGRVLLVEDNAVTRILAQRLLQKRGFTVSIAADGKQAIAAMHKTEFDLVLMEIQMPETDGFEATAEIWKDEKLTGHHALRRDSAPLPKSAQRATTVLLCLHLQMYPLQNSRR